MINSKYLLLVTKDDPADEMNDQVKFSSNIKYKMKRGLIYPSNHSFNVSFTNKLTFGTEVDNYFLHISSNSTWYQIQ